MGLIGSAETLVLNYLTPRNNPEDRRIYLKVRFQEKILRNTQKHVIVAGN
jgi:hypothetical protein